MKEKEILKVCKNHGETIFVLENDKKYNCTRYRCRKCRNDRVLEKRKNNKLSLLKKFGGKCQICGYNKFAGALEFHHMDKDSKEFGIAAKGCTLAYSRVEKEAEKCILLCTNCHREVENDMTEIPDHIKEEFYKK